MGKPLDLLQSTLDVCVTEPTPAFEAPAASSAEPRSFGSRLWGRLRGTSAP